MKLSNILGHLKTILVHKYWVFYYCCMFEIPWRGITHDLSKFSPVEFIEGCKFYQGGKSSPIPAAKREQGYSLAWQHHKGRNPHHYEYWTDNYDTGVTTIKIPYKDTLELICDYLAAGRTYNGKSFTFESEFKWWMNKVDSIKMYLGNKRFISWVFRELSSGEFTNINKKKLKEVYNMFL